MAPIIRAILAELLGEEIATEIEIIANDVDIKEDGSWEIKYRHPDRYVAVVANEFTYSISGFGHDKSHSILPYRNLPNPPTIFFFGDGVSDMSAAQHADVLFVKQTVSGENDLSRYCKSQNIPHLMFPSFNQALEVVKTVVAGTTPAEIYAAAPKA